MKAEELTGKRALRIVETPNADLPFSLTKVPVIIEKATETHIVCRVDNTQALLSMPQSEPTLPKKSIGKRILLCFIPQFLIPKPAQPQTLPDTPFILDRQYCDDNWIDYDELIVGTSLDNNNIDTGFAKTEFGSLLSVPNMALLILLGIATYLALTYFFDVNAKWAMNIAVILSVLVFGGEMFFVMAKKRRKTQDTQQSANEDTSTPGERS